MSSFKSNLPITSREYKLLLKTENFDDREKGTENFRNILQTSVSEIGGNFIKSTEDIKRITWFLDTPDDLLLNLGYILRVRYEVNDPKCYKITLKFRHPDRYISSSVNMNSPENVKSKFEEDILHPFTSKFSQSVSFRKKDMPRFLTIFDILNYFPKINLHGIHSHSPIVVRSDFKAYEITRRIGTVNFGADMHMKCCLNFWYRSKDCTGIPVVSEFSFDYDADEDSGIAESYPENTVRNAYEIYRKMQTKTDWFDPVSKTKTALIGDLKP